MSLIVDALKKTQSALNPHEEQLHKKSDALITESPPPMTFSISKKHDFEFVNRWSIGFFALVLLGFLIALTHTYIAHLAARYVNFYGDLAHEISSGKVQKPVVISEKAAPVINFTLDGTLQMNGEHVALINNRLYYVGQIIEGFQIKRIHYNTVTVVNPITHQETVLTPALAQ